MNREQALEIINKYIQSESLIKHSLCVEAAMRWYAEKQGEDIETWGLAGLLHDFDWEIHPQSPDHPEKGAPILRELGVPENIVQAILAHGPSRSTPRDSKMAIALNACDEVTGLITACALVRPSKSIADLTVKSVKKKWKNLSFAAGANREEIAQGAEEFNIELWEHVGNIIASMQEIAEEIGLAGVTNH
jgi:putative nucleotidyltransferase with HDIG domain